MIFFQFIQNKDCIQSFGRKSHIIFYLEILIFPCQVSVLQDNPVLIIHAYLL